VHGIVSFFVIIISNDVVTSKKKNQLCWILNM